LRSASLSADGRRVLTVSDDRTVRVWDVASSQLLAPPLRHDRGVDYAEFSRDGRRVLTTTEDSVLYLWDLTPDDRPLDELLTLARGLRGRESHPPASVVPTDAETFLRDWRALKEKDPAALGPAPPGQVAAWHGEEAEASALGKNWAATL